MKTPLFKCFIFIACFFVQNFTFAYKAKDLKAVPAVEETIPILGGNTWTVTKGSPEKWWGPTVSTVSANYTTYPNQLDEPTVVPQAHSGPAHTWAYSSSYSNASFSITRQRRWLKNGGRLKGQDADDRDSYDWFLTINFSKPVPANEIYLFLYDIDHRGTTTNYAPSASIRFGTSEAGPTDFEALTPVSVTGVDNPMNQMAYGAGGNITLTGINATGDRNAYVALAGKNSKTVSTIEIEMKNIGDDVAVELGWLNVNSDFGDAPDSYATNTASTGASHYIVPSLYMGDSVDGESSGQANTTASGDDDDANGDDENGIYSEGASNQTPPKIQNTKTTDEEIISSYSVSVKVTNKTASNARLLGWVDWNRDGTFEAGEGASVDVAANSDNSTTTLTWTNQLLNHTGFNGFTFLRLRLSTDVLLTTGMPAGILKDGEVEDYMVDLTQSTTLPITLSDFKGKAVENGNISLNWKTTYESVSRGFEIQRSMDAKNFQTIGFLASHNLQNTVNQYEYLDVTAPRTSNTIYYRLKSVDLDDSFSYSGTLSVRLSETENIKFAVWPNPAQGNDEITFSALEPVTSLRMYDLLGREIRLDTTKQLTKSKLKLSDLRPGLYLLRVNDTQTLKMIIK